MRNDLVVPLAAIAGCAAALVGAPLAAQGRVSGVVLAGGRPVPEANVFLLETLDGAVTGVDGRFALALGDSAGTLVVRRIGFVEARVRVRGADSALTVTLEPARPPLTPITVLAGRHTADTERGATLSPIEVATTPGTTANVNRAIQTLPGVPQVDDGTALFVRGGDFTETRSFINGAGLLTPPQLLTPTGTYVGTVDPFQLEGIFFSSGGFGARYGNALSGIVDLSTQGRPPARSVTAGVGMAALSASAATPLGTRGGAWIAANRFDLTPILRVNGSPRDFAPPPRGYEVAGSAAWRRGDGGEVKLYALDSRTRLGVRLDDPSFSGRYAADEGASLAVLSWRDEVGRVRPTASASLQRLARDEDFGAFRMTLGQTVAHASLGVAFLAHERATVRVGGEVERLASTLDGTVPAGASAAPDARLRVLGGDRAGVRDAAYLEADVRAARTVRVVAGARTDRSTLATRRTVDPRLSLAWRPRDGITLTGAWGIYHQVPDPLLLDRGLGVPSLAPMRATQTIVGVQVGEERRMLRIEAWDKTYADLALLATEPGRARVVRGGGTGHARGFDLIAKSRLPWRIDGRVTYGFVDATRTDAVTGVRARAPMDITHALTAVVERRFGVGWQAGLAWRQATGRPFTPVVAAVPEAGRATFTPVWGAPFAERFPDFRRLDASLSHVRLLGPRLQGVFYLSLTNLLDRENVQAWRYSPDFAERSPVRSVFNRAVYVGASLTLR